MLEKEKTPPRTAAGSEKSLAHGKMTNDETRMTKE